MRNRLKFIDFARGAAILVVVTGHYVEFNFDGQSAETVLGFIGSFQMPLFFFISGYVAAISRDKIQKFEAVNYLKKRALTLMLPFIVWGIIIPQFLSDVIFGLSDYLTKIYDVFTQPDNGPWFLLTLFFIQIYFLILCLVGNINKDRTLLYESIAVCVIVVICYAGERVTHSSYYFNYQYTIAFLVGYFVNYHYVTQVPRLVLLDKCSKCVLLISFVVFWYYSIRFDFWLSPGWQRMIAGICISLCVIYVSRRIDITRYRISQLISWIGKYTLEIYVVHYYLVTFVFYKINVSTIKPVPLFVLALIASLGISLCVIVFAKTISKIPYVDLILFGKMRKKTVVSISE